MSKPAMILLEDAIKGKMPPALDTFACPYTGESTRNSVIRIIFPEFTCLCPKTGYPDFASIDLYYLPGKRCIELKSWKLFLNSFRMIGTFHETVISFLFEKVKKSLAPRWLLLAGDFFPRGNVNTTIIFETGTRPEAAVFLVKKYQPYSRTFGE
jgi:7-cyano-7-deazaguanine reductase